MIGLENYGDIASAFDQEMMRSGDESMATRAAFEQWYAVGWRKLSYHMQACMAYLDKLNASDTLQNYRQLPGRFFDDLCTLPDGKLYGCHLTDQLSTASD